MSQRDEQMRCAAVAARCSIGRLFALRNHWRDGPMARANCRRWIRDARELVALGAWE